MDPTVFKLRQSRIDTWHAITKPACMHCCNCFQKLPDANHKILILPKATCFIVSSNCLVKLLITLGEKITFWLLTTYLKVAIRIFQTIPLSSMFLTHSTCGISVYFGSFLYIFWDTLYVALLEHYITLGRLFDRFWLHVHQTLRRLR